MTANYYGNYHDNKAQHWCELELSHTSSQSPVKSAGVPAPTAKPRL